ncbi:hypothetical protein [Natronoglomus mannanivorans]|uniref:Uncharacterized protein n=1 Tax=Natronoglomus mannanivorans TaxID=2979990 RepID=A0AAP3E534_9EURY|nr:hypothetical protein [Halobacteria archaeon AArc-xg1-1]
MPLSNLNQHPQDDLLIAAALCWFSKDFEDVEPELALRAWEISQELCELHGLNPGEAIRQIELC